MERMLDKRKARDKETDDESTDTSLNKNPTKRARVDFSSTKEESPSASPASGQKNSSKAATGTDTGTATVSASTVNDVGKSDKSGSSSSNGDVGSSPSKAKNNGSSEGSAGISKFNLPAPFTSQELEQKIGKSGDIKEDSDSDNGSTKFLSGIIQNEENKRKRQVKGKGGVSSNTAGSGDSGGRNGTPVSHATKRGSVSASSNGKTQGKPQPTMTSSPLSDLPMASPVSNGNMELEIVVKLNHPTTHAPFLEETIFLTDFKTVDTFFRQHKLALAPPSSQSQVSSTGYMGDVSSLENSASNIQGSSKSSGSSNSRWTLSSLGSTIPRHSIVSIATEAPDSPEEKMKRPGRPPASTARKGSDGPIMSSTKYDDSTRSSSSSLLDRMNVSANPVSNGDELSSSNASSQKGSTKSQPSRATTDSTASPVKKLKGATPSRFLDRDEGIGTPSQGSTPGSSSSPRKSMKATPGSSAASTSRSSDSGRSTGKKPGARRRVGSASNFPITMIPGPVLNTPPPARNVAKIEGISAKPVSRFEQEMNDEPVNLTDLQKASTLWSTILPEELVFARWRDKSYYSGMVKNKGLNDTWIIDFDDGMEDVASESHIVPIRILGVGVKGVYSPDEKYEAKSAEVIGQKFGVDPDTGRQAVKYAIKISGDPKPIWCSRRQLSIKEIDAKKLRSEYQPPLAGPKAGDVSLDNIVSGPRRRTRGMESEGSASDSKLVAGAFDASSAGDNLETATPKSQRGPKSGKKTPASEAKRKPRTPAATPTPVVASTSTPQPKISDEPLPVKEIVEKKESPPKKESPTRNKKSLIEFGKKKSKKILFQGIQFFLTASGGGDPGVGGTQVVPADPYDKDETREQLESCGGQIIDTVGNETAADVFLISDSYARTVKYIYSLAASIPCISHSWVQRCLEVNEIVDWKVFTLPAGWSLEHQDLIQHHVRKPLQGCKVFVTSESDQLYNYWKPVLTAAEAVLLKPPRKKGLYVPTGTEVVVTDNHSDTTNEVLREAKALNLPVVRPEWLVQTIITGEKAHMYGHDKYKILFETEESEDPTEGESAIVEETKENCFDVMAYMQSPD